MAFPLKPRKPTIDWNHPISKSLAIDVPMFEKGGKTIRELVTNTNGDFSGTPVWAITPFGPAIRFPTSSDSLSFQKVRDLNNDKNITVQLLAYITADTSGGTLLRKGNVTEYNLAVELDDGCNGVGCFVRDSAGTQGFGVSSYNLYNRWHNIIMTYENRYATTTRPVWHRRMMDSNNQNTLGITNTCFQVPHNGSVKVDTSDLKLGGGAGGNSLALARVWTRILTKEEITTINTDPWQIYNKPKSDF